MRGSIYAPRMVEAIRRTPGPTKARILPLMRPLGSAEVSAGCPPRATRGEAVAREFAVLTVNVLFQFGLGQCPQAPPQGFNDGPRAADRAPTEARSTG
jgi:hypothetical protein